MIINEALNKEAMMAGTRAGKNESGASVCSKIENDILTSFTVNIVLGQ